MTKDDVGNDEFRMSNDELPNGWIETQIQHVARVGTGSTPLRSNPKFFASEGIPWITSAATSWQIVTKAEQFVTAAAMVAHRLKRFPVGTLLVAMYGEGRTRGQVTELGIEATINQACAAVVVDESIAIRRFVKFALQASYLEMREMAEGGNQPNLNLSKVREFPLLLPPLAEQKRIADKLEAALARVDACRTRLDRVPALLKRFRQSVLAAATSGKVTEEWRTANGVTDEWDLISLEDSIQRIEQGWSPKCESEPSLSPYEWAVIKTTAIQAMQFLEFENKRLPKNLKPRPDLEIRPGDILITRAGPRGRAAVTCMVPAIRPRLIACDKAYRFRARENRTTPEYLNVYLNSPRVIQELDEMKTGISDSGVNLTQSKFLSMQIPLPTLLEQQEIVRRVEDLFAFADRIEARLAAVRKTVERLTPSVLAKAFRGDLVPQDPHDEPASALLARLTHQSAIATKPARAKRTNRP